ncbi:MAG: transglycosylase domain-containing protein, partial [Acidimicrobiales bacterium]
MYSVPRPFKWAVSSVVLTVVTVVCAPILAAFVILLALVYLPLPATIPVAKTVSIPQPTVIYDQNGNVIATLAQYDREIPVAESAIPEILKEAVISDEDRNFYREGGASLTGIVRAFLADVRSNKVVQGGSTITEQYVKLTYTSGADNVFRKLQEVILANQLARSASKNDILYHYLSAIYWGDGNYGIGAAAENYFHEPVQDLNASQSAMLAGLLPAPTSRAPREHPSQAEQYRELVLGEMHQQGYITDTQYSQDMSAQIEVADGGVPASPGSTVVYPAPGESSAYPDFVDYVVRWLLANYPYNEVYGGGLKVQTTLNPQVQAAAYAAVQSTMNGAPAQDEMALAAVQPQTGYVEAIVGGTNFGKAGTPYAADNFAISGCDPPPPSNVSVQVSATCWTYNSSQDGVVQAGSDGRQPGSAWKPFVLATALEQGISPDAVYAAPTVYQIPGCVVPANQTPDYCQVHNDEGEGGGSLTLAQATVQSVNTVYAQVAPQVGCANVAETAKALGVVSAYFSPTVFPQCPRYALGELDVSPLEMASAYGVFANNGQYATPTPVLEVINGSGKVILDNIHPQPSTTQVMPANITENVTSVLQGVLVSGTAAGKGIGRPAAGKTGTASNETNAWFVGYTPTLSAAVWLGNATSQAISLNGFYDTASPIPDENMVGGGFPASTWQAFMKQAMNGVPVSQFDQPVPISTPNGISPGLSAPSGPSGPVSPGSDSVQTVPTGGPYAPTTTTTPTT